MRCRVVPKLELLIALALLPSVAVAQSATPPQQLSLADALRLARINSPTYLQSVNDEGPANAAVRASYGNLFPSVSTGLGLDYTKAGSQSFANQIFRNSSQIGSSYSINASLALSYSKFLAPERSKAERRVTEENIADAGVSLKADVTSQYLAVLRADANVGVVEQQLNRNQEFLTQTRAKFKVGKGTMVEVRQAEVSKAASQVALLRARQATVNARIELLRRIGMPPDPDVANLELSDTFALSKPDWELATLLAEAHRSNPRLQAAAAQNDAASIGVRSAISAYYPTLSISTGLRGFTQQSTSVDPLLNNALAGAKGQASNCRFQNYILERLTSPVPLPNGGIEPNCNAFAGLNDAGTALQPEIANQIRDRNSGWPFGFTNQPWGISLSISLPIFNGFSRARDVSSARAAEDDAREAARARRIEVDGQIQSGLLAVNTAWQAAAIADTNRAAAADRLVLARQRYDIGNGTALEVADAENAVTQAEFDYVAAVYDYHTAVVALEASVGRPIH